MISDLFYFDVSEVHIAHECVIDRAHRCDYPDGRGSFGLALVLDGEATYRFTDGQRLTVHQGEILFLRPDSSYSVYTGGEFKHYTINFDIKNDISDIDFLDTPCYVFAPRQPDNYVPGFRRAALFWKEKKCGYVMAVKSCIYEILAAVCNEIGEGQVAQSEQLRRAREFIEKNFAEDFELDDIALTVNMSVTNFRREWKRAFGISPMQYRDKIRLATAEQHLSLGLYTVSEVGELCGFADTSYFVRFFKKHRGIPPGKFKKTTVLL